MDLLIALLIGVVYWTIGCMIIGMARQNERAMNITILLLWPLIIFGFVVYGVVNWLLKMGKRGKTSK